MLWSDYENRELVVRAAPWFLRTYDALPLPIMRADSVRYLYMLEFGGVYADLDVVSLETLDEYLIGPANATAPRRMQRPQLVLPRMGSFDSHHAIPNAWMASVPAHSFWLFLLQRIQARVDSGKDLSRPEFVTGPAALKRAYVKYRGLAVSSQSRITLLGPRTSLFLLPSLASICCSSSVVLFFLLLV
jgi:hypothetical protein